MRPVLSIAALSFLSVPAAADFKGGLAAYQRGDYSAALAQWLPDAERGDASAQYNVGLLHARGAAGVPRDYAEAAGWYSKAAGGGIASAQFNLGLLYETGQGVARDPAAAARLYRKAADQGLPDAALNLGVLYEEGAGVERDPAEAERWYKAAADFGMPKAQFNLGLLYDSRGEHAKAMEWYRRAAGQGNPSAMKNLGVLFYNGEGAGRDLIQAYIWFARAEVGGVEFAGQLRGIVARKLRKAEIERAEREVAAWRPVTEAHDESPAVNSPVRAPAMGFTPASADR